MSMSAGCGYSLSGRDVRVDNTDCIELQDVSMGVGTGALSQVLRTSLASESSVAFGTCAQNASIVYANIDAISTSGDTPLMVLLKYRGSLPFVELFINNGASISIENNDLQAGIVASVKKQNLVIFLSSSTSDYIAKENPDLGFPEL